MDKYEYINGERRYHHHVAIWYDLAGEDGKHWYIRLCTSLQDNNLGSRSRTHNVYFKTLVEAKRYIDEF